MGNPYPGYTGPTFEEIESLGKYMNRMGINPKSMMVDPRYFMTDDECVKYRKKIQIGLRPTYGEHLFIDEYGFFGNFSTSLNAASSFINPVPECLRLNQKYALNGNSYYNENLLSVLHENPDDLEFGGYSPLCDTAVYYFIEDYFEYEDYVNYAVSKESQESVPINYLDEDDDDEDYDVLDAEGLDFWLFCATIGIKLKPIDCLMEDA